MNPSPDNQQNNKLLALMLASFPCGNFHHCLLQVTNIEVIESKIRKKCTEACNLQNSHHRKTHK